MKLLRGIGSALLLIASLSYAASVRAEAPPIVRAVLFYSPTCPHCHSVMEEVLPPLRVQYGDQLDILEINVNAEAGAQLYYAAVEALAIPPERLFVPTLIVGDTVLVGSLEIPEQFPGLIERHLAAGGVDWPAIPGLETIAPPPKPSSTPTSESPKPVVRAVLFWSSECPACRKVVAETLPPLRERYSSQLDIQLMDVVTAEDVDRLYQVAAALGVSQDDVDLPLLIIADWVLVGAEQIPAELPGLIEKHLAAGGAALPDVSGVTRPLPTPERSSPASESAVAQPMSNGFALAITTMVSMVGALVYTGVTVMRSLRGARLRPPPRWLEYAIPALALGGFGVAGYLAYVETQAVPAVCGPVGECNVVQSSSYARLFGVLPIGVLGVIGYAAILGAWFWGRLGSDRVGDLASLVLFGLTVFGVVFSLYLTYLEPFVIGAVCAWCLASAAVMTLLMLISLKPATHALRAIRKGA